MMKITIIFVIIMFSCIMLIAQDYNSEEHQIIIEIPEVALLDLESNSSSTILLSADAANSAGMDLDFSTVNDNSIWLNYSSIIGEGFNSSRNVNVVVSGLIPEGVRLKLLTSTDVGQGNGDVGVPLSGVILSNQPQNIISNIGSCYTGEGVFKGHQLTYSLELDEARNYADLSILSVPLTVTFTLTEDY